MPHPQNILEALPSAGVPRPTNVLETVPVGGSTTRIGNALATFAAPKPVNTLDSFPGLTADYHPDIIIDALPVTPSPGFLNPMIAITDVWSGGWGSTLPDYSQAIQPAGPGGFVQSSDTTGGIGVAWGFGPPSAATPSTGWTLNITARKRSNVSPITDVPCIGITLNVFADTFIPGVGWTGLGGTGGAFANPGGIGNVAAYLFGPIGGGIALTLAFTVYGIAIPAPAMATMVADYLTLQAAAVPPQFAALKVQLTSITTNGDGGTPNNFCEVDEITWDR